MTLMRHVRKVVPSVAALSHRRWLMAPLDVIDRVVNWPWPEARRLPPNRYRLRVGVGSRLLFNAFYYRYHAVDFWMHALATGLITPTSRILDLGCGCGRYAVVLRRLNHKGWRFTGRYTGLDIDREMIDWCGRHFPPARFQFVWANRYSKVYNAGDTADRAAGYRLPFADGQFDFVFSTSLFTHLLEDDARNYLAEAHRVLRPGGRMSMSVFCLDEVRDRLGGRFTFAHRMGPAYVESVKYPEAAVAYERQWLFDACAAAGFTDVALTGATLQQDLVATRG